MGLKRTKSRAKINKQQVYKGLGVFQGLNSQMVLIMASCVPCPCLYANGYESSIELTSALSTNTKNFITIEVTVAGL